MTQLRNESRIGNKDWGIIEIESMKKDMGMNEIIPKEILEVKQEKTRTDLQNGWLKAVETDSAKKTGRG